MNKMDLTQRLENCYSGAVFDVMRELGLKDGLLPRHLKSLDPEVTVCGPVSTVLGRPDSSLTEDESLLRWTELLGKAPAGHVVVCQPQDDHRALMGELSAETLQFRGVRGYVVDGGCRDVSFIRKMKFPVFCRFTTPRDIVAAWTPEEYEVPITIGEVTIQSGDYILGDQDGVVVLPGIHAESIINRVEEVMQTENLVRKAILEGIHPKEAYLRHRKF